MRNSILIATAVTVLSTIFASAPGTSAQKTRQPAALKVCADPSAPCTSPAKEFAPYELSFTLPRRLRANVEYKSAQFFAVFLKTYTYTVDNECDQGEYSEFIERERKQVQQMFPERKVFADHQCPDMGAVSYIIAGQSGEYGPGPFLAVYAATRAEAEQVLAKVKAKYPAATIKGMQVSYSRIEQ